ncbi:SUMO protease ULP1 [Aspergillus lucknowensis]|uniref:Ubiquitin-like protease family profile domain-containing protein n=1 Tax=Aspergillus lucknowensis TaxID=176173 RepID=A0ABR4LDH5_9EURO
MEDPMIITQQPEVEDVMMTDASLLSEHESPLGAREAAFDPMDISTSPSNGRTLQASQNFRPAAGEQHFDSLHDPSSFNASRCTAPLFPKKKAADLHVPFRFSPPGKTARPPSTAPVYHRVAELKPYQNSSTSNVTTTTTRWSRLSGLGPAIHHMPGSQVPSFGSTNTSRGSSFSSLDTQKSTEDGKENSFDSLTSISTVPSSLSRKRSIDDGLQIGLSQSSTVRASSGSPPKYRRLSVDGIAIPGGNIDIPAAGHAQSNSLRSPSPATLSPVALATSLELSPDAMDIDTPVRKDQDSRTNTPTNIDRVPGCWPYTPVPTYETTPCPSPKFSTNRYAEAPMMSGAILPPETDSVHMSALPHIAASGESDLLSNGRDSVVPMPAVPDAQSPASTWYAYYAALYQSIKAMFQNRFMGTVANAFKGAIASAGSLGQQAMGFLENRRRRARGSSPTRRHSPTRANLRHLPLEQQQRLKANQWRKDRGYPIIEDFPFPQLSFDSPQIHSPPQAISQPEDNVQPTEEVLDATSRAAAELTHKLSVRSWGPATSPVPKRNTPGPMTSTSGVRKRSGVSSLSPQMKRRLHLSPRSREERRRRELNFLRVLKIGHLENLGGLPPAEGTARATAPIEEQPAQTEALDSNDQASMPSNPLKPKRRVRFQEPLVTEPVRMALPLGADLAPYLRSCLKSRRPVADEKTFIEQKENIPPESVPETEVVVEIGAREDVEADEPSVDPWLQPEEFPLGRSVSAVSLFYPVPKPLPPGRTESIYAAEWRKMEEEKKLSERPTRIKREGTAVRPLAPKWETRVDEAMRLPSNRKIATTLSGDPLTKKDLATCYIPETWLNDEVVNAYLALIIDYLRRAHGNAGRHDKPRFHAFNSFFFSNLRDKGYESVRRWAARAKIGGQGLLNVDTVFVPVHNQYHWTLIVVKPSDRTIEHFDSMGSLSHRHVGLVKNWLRGELGQLYVDDEWTVLPSVSPQQNNGSDCGVFLLSTAKAVALDIDPMSYGAKNTRLLRKKIVAELMNGGFEGDFDPTDENGEVLL